MLDEPLSRAILQAAINEGRAAELLLCLFDGGSCTIDPDTLKLVLVCGIGGGWLLNDFDPIGLSTDEAIESLRENPDWYGREKCT